METTPATRSDKGSSNFHARRRRRDRGWKVRRRLALAYRRRHNVADYPSSEATQAKGGELTSSPPLMYFMKYAVPSALVFVSVTYQGRKLLENPASWCFLGATCVYWLISGAMKRTTDVHGNCYQTLSYAALASAIFSAISMVSIFLPHPVTLLPVAILISSPLVMALVCAFSLFLRGIEYVTNGIHAMVVLARGPSSDREVPPPV